MLKKMWKDNSGQMLPFMAGVMMIMTMVGTYSLGLSMIYRDRLIIRDALDAAASAALAGATELRSMDIDYFEYCIGGYWESYSYTYTDIYGEEHEDSWDEWVCLGYDIDSGNPQQYIYVNEPLARTLADEYFAANVTMNGLSFTKLTWEFTLKYDNTRYITVVKNRPRFPGANPPYWWISQFGDTIPSNWSGFGNETRYVRFPRWAEVTIIVRVETTAPFGKLLGKKTVISRFKTTHYQEIK